MARCVVNKRLFLRWPEQVLVAHTAASQARFRRFTYRDIGVAHLAPYYHSSPTHGASFMPRKHVAVGELESLVRSVTPETVAETPYIAPAYADLREILEETRQLMAERDRYTLIRTRSES